MKLTWGALPLFSLPWAIFLCHCRRSAPCHEGFSEYLLAARPFECNLMVVVFYEPVNPEMAVGIAPPVRAPLWVGRHTLWATLQDGRRLPNDDVECMSSGVKLWPWRLADASCTGTSSRRSSASFTRRGAWCSAWTLEGVLHSSA